VTSLFIRTIVFAVLIPASVVLYLPAAILGASHDTFALDGWRVIGLVPLTVGLGVLFLCWIGFIVEGRGTPAPYDPPRRLVTGALYDRVRNPMYVGLTSALVGEAIVFASVPLLAWAIVAWLLFHLAVVGFEEPSLRDRFDGPYEDYLRRVPRWIPRW
jgi:protein-S-isoprenylcysteine O-methyltransferase Ste14